MKEKVSSVSLGVKTENGLHFLSIALSEGPTNQEVQQIANLLQKYFEEGGPFLIREFVRNEIQITPSLRSREYFETLGSAVYEYHQVLRVLGLAGFTITVDGDILPFDDRDPRPVEEIARENRAAFDTWRGHVRQ